MLPPYPQFAFEGVSGVERGLRHQFATQTLRVHLLGKRTGKRSKSEDFVEEKNPQGSLKEQGKAERCVFDKQSPIEGKFAPEFKQSRAAKRGDFKQAGFPIASRPYRFALCPVLP